MSKNEITDGSMRTLWRISSPLMISFLSLMTMLFVDRLYLSRYSASALSAAASAGTLGFGFNLGWVTLAAMSEVFVAQYNGAKEYGKLARPVWQMIWVSVGTIAFFTPLAIWGAKAIYGAADKIYELEYFRWYILMSPFSVLLSALTAFFVGQGKTRVIQMLSIFGNLVNIGLDPLFIFGYKGIIPSMGVKGAAIATGIGVIFQALILLGIFLKRANSIEFGTRQWHLDGKLMRQIFRIATPSALFCTLELLGWGFFYNMMALISPVHVFVCGVCQSILLLFLFFGLGLEKGAAAVAGNLIGAGKLDEVKRVFSSGLKMVWLFTVPLFAVFLIWPDPIIDWFLRGDMSAMESAKPLIRFGLIFSAFNILFENIRWLLNGILSAAGDTLFLMIAGTLCVWFLLCAPTYFIIVKTKASVESAFSVWVLYTGVSMVVFAWRYFQGRWREKTITA